ncbi:MAG: hypothetical protein ABI794_11085 [Betaproteobacteria bacterium]
MSNPDSRSRTRQAGGPAAPGFVECGLVALKHFGTPLAQILVFNPK